MPLMVCSPDVDHPGKATLDEFVVVVGDVSGKVCWSAVASHQHVILVLTKGSRGEPNRSLFLTNVAPLLEESHNPVILPLFEKAIFIEPDIEGYAQCFKVGLNSLHDLSHSNLAQFGWLA